MASSERLEVRKFAWSVAECAAKIDQLDLDVQVVLRAGDVETAVVTYTWAVRAPRG